MMFFEVKHGNLNVTLFTTHENTLNTFTSVHIVNVGCLTSIWQMPNLTISGWVKTLQTFPDPCQTSPDPRRTSQDPRRTSLDPRRTSPDPRRTSQDPNRTSLDMSLCEWSGERGIPEYFLIGCIKMIQLTSAWLCYFYGTTDGVAISPPPLHHSPIQN